MNTNVFLKLSLLLLSTACLSTAWAAERRFHLDKDAEGDVVHVLCFGPARSLLDSCKRGDCPISIPTVASVSLNQHRVTREELEVVASFKNVSYLDIGLAPDECEIVSGALDPIGKMSWLIGLTVREDDLGDKDVECLGSLPQLEMLEICGSSNFSHRTITHLLKMPKLTHLELRGSFPEPSLASLVRLVNIEHMRIDSPSMTVNLAQKLLTLPKLDQQSKRRLQSVVE